MRQLLSIFYRVDEEEGRYDIDELADLGGVSRRTVRYYVQEGLLPAPLRRRDEGATTARRTSTVCLK